MNRKCLHPAMRHTLTVNSYEFSFLRGALLVVLHVVVKLTDYGDTEPAPFYQIKAVSFSI